MTEQTPKPKIPDAPRRAAVGGRPTALTTELIDEAAGHLRTGTPITTIAALLGVGAATFHAWIKRGRIEERRMEQVKTRRPKASELLFLMLYRTVVEQRAIFEAQALKRINSAAEAGAWAADAWLLKQLLPMRYSERRHQVLSVTPTKKRGGAPALPPAASDPTAAPTFLDMAKQVFAVPTSTTPKLTTTETAGVFGAAPAPPKVLEPEIVSGGKAAEEKHGREEEGSEEDVDDPFGVFDDPAITDEDDGA